MTFDYTAALDAALSEVCARVDARLSGSALLPLSIDLSRFYSRAQRGPRRAFKRTLADILGKVNEAFSIATLQLDNSTTSPISKDTLRGLRAMGPWVPFGSPWLSQDNESFDFASRKWPALLYVSRGYASDDYDGYDSENKQYGFVAAAYAVRLQRQPWNVERIDGMSYEFGMGFRYKKAISWIISHVTVIPSVRQIHVCAERTARDINISKRSGAYTRVEWIIPALYGQSQWGAHKDERAAVLADVFTNTLTWWRRRDERWTVGLRDLRNDRVSFSIENADAKHFFKDRGLEAIAADGKRKRIIHLVTEHQRVTSQGHTTVREHLRGLRAFNWRGYGVSITAPKFHTWKIHSFDLPAVDEDDVPHTQSVVTIGQWANALATMEDSQRVVNVKGEPASKAMPDRAMG